MKLRFAANQDFQLEAISAIVDLFDGQPRIEAPEFRMWEETEVSAVTNRLDLHEEQILTNLHAVQTMNRISIDHGLRRIEGEGRTFPNFSVEMETGTGKTYVYLRTILELNRRYGLRKFVVVVPSVAVREGVLKTLDITRDHFRALFDNTPYAYYRYDSATLARVRQFAHSNDVEIMIMTIDSFNRAANIMVRLMDQMQGHVPIHLVQATHPVLILDEPQNLESETSRAALARLNPLFALRYSATHRDPYNLVYRLTPYQAYQRALVKRIQVASVVKTDDANRPFIRLQEIRVRGGRAVARVAIHKLMARGAVQESVVTVSPGDKLSEKASRSEYAGYDVDTIDPVEGFIRFAPNDVQLRPGEAVGADKDAIFRAQIRYTVERHIETQRRLRERGIKVLSLFFIDRVDNYAPADGIIRRLFNEAFEDLKSGVPEWKGLSAADVQAAYFAERRRRDGEVELLESASGESQQDEAAYDLIMRDKESLLSFPESGDDDETRRRKQRCFIFSHSALREGWDSPNVFQICTLNQAASNVRKRQEVGRGVRLAVDQAGDRVLDTQVNVLTVVANESYQRYVATLQSEIADEYKSEIEARYGKPLDALTDAERQKIVEQYGQGILPPPPAPVDRPKAQLRKARVGSPEFKELWERIKHKTRYAVSIDSEKLLTDVTPELNRRTIEPPRVTITEAEAMVKEGTPGFIAVQRRAERTVEVLAVKPARPNLVAVMAELMERTTPRVMLTRRTLLQVVKRTAKKDAFLQNPYEFARVAVGILKQKLIDQLVEGIKYEKIDGGWWEMQRILDEEVVALFSKFTEPAERALYDAVPCDSKVERDFVRAMEDRKDVRLHMKLPPWFVVPTPLGEYRPDWAVVLDNPDGGEPLLYLVAETKGTTEESARRSTENLKIECARSHFGSQERNVKGALTGVDYKVIRDASQLP